MSEWISVEDRIPEKAMPCMVYIADRGSVMLTNFNGDFALVRVGYPTGFSAHGVTHWMSLPEPPRSKDDE